MTKNMDFRSKAAQVRTSLVASLTRWLESFSFGRFCIRMLGKKLVKFFLVAGLNTAFGYAIYAFFIFIGLPYWLAALLGQVIGILFNFGTYGALVFKNKKVNLLPRFLCVYAITYFCNVGGMRFLKYTFGMSDYYTAIVMLLPVGLLNFILSKVFVFERKETSANRSIKAEPGKSSEK